MSTRKAKKIKHTVRLKRVQKPRKVPVFLIGFIGTVVVGRMVFNRKRLDPKTLDDVYGTVFKAAVML